MKLHIKRQSQSAFLRHNINKIRFSFKRNIELQYFLRDPCVQAHNFIAKMIE